MQEESKKIRQNLLFSPRNLAVTTAPPETQVRHVDHWPVIFHDPSRGQAFQENACPAAFPEKGRIPARTAGSGKCRSYQVPEKVKNHFRDLDELLAVCPQRLFVHNHPIQLCLGFWASALFFPESWLMSFQLKRKWKSWRMLIFFLLFCLGLTTCSRMWH